MLKKNPFVKCQSKGMYRMFYQNVHKYLTLDIINSLQLELQSEFLTGRKDEKKMNKKYQ